MQCGRQRFGIRRCFIGLATMACTSSSIQFCSERKMHFAANRYFLTFTLSKLLWALHELIGNRIWSSLVALARQMMPWAPSFPCLWNLRCVERCSGDLLHSTNSLLASLGLFCAILNSVLLLLLHPSWCPPQSSYALVWNLYNSTVLH